MKNLFVIRLKKQHIWTLAAFVTVGVFAFTFFRGVKFMVGAHENKNFIKYAEFNPSYEALDKAMREDIKSHGEEIKINWIEVLACLGTKYGGDFKKYKEKIWMKS